MNEVKIANPGPLGLSGFALTTLILSLVNAGLIGGGNVAIVLGLALFYGGIAQLLAGMWEFRSGNTFGATAFTSYGAFWLSFAALFVPGLGNSTLKLDDTGLGWYLLGWAIVTGILTIASFRTNGATALVFILLFITFLLLAFGAFNKAPAGTGLTQIGGYVGIITAIAAWYAALAGVLASVKINLPVFPLSS
ncbi:MAG TPA: acetate uptake transporter [Ktedonobacterales bacterium]|nr:acetate uptake transporter [Ktedonobacterales bacterium]